MKPSYLPNLNDNFKTEMNSDKNSFKPVSMAFRHHPMIETIRLPTTKKQFEKSNAFSNAKIKRRVSLNV